MPAKETGRDLSANQSYGPGSHFRSTPQCAAKASTISRATARSRFGCVDGAGGRAADPVFPGCAADTTPGHPGTVGERKDLSDRTHDSAGYSEQHRLCAL